MGSIEIKGLSKSFGPTTVLRDVSLTVDDGEFFFILGPSGCGKSTLLRIVAGLETQDKGSVQINGKVVDKIPANHRGIGMVFQQYALWPHMTVERNIGFGLEVRKVRAHERRAKIERSLASVRLEGLAARYPHELSGGQQQRVALARALVTEPKVILLDEPLSNLDARLRDEIRTELAALHRSLGVTMICVTHDQEDALALASRMAIMRNGKIVQVGTPEEVYTKPISTYVARFLGDANLIPSSLLGLSVEGYLCVRPEAVAITGVDGDKARLIGTVLKTTFKGSHVETVVSIAEGVSVTAHAPSSTRDQLRSGASVGISWAKEDETVVREVPGE